MFSTLTHIYVCMICSQRKCLRYSMHSERPHCTQNWNRSSRCDDCRLFNHMQSSSHCLSHLLPPEKHHLGLRPRGHRYTLPICPNELCKSSFIPRSLFSFLWFFFIYSCLICSVLYYCITFAFVICFNKEISNKSRDFTLLSSLFCDVSTCFIVDWSAASA